MNEQERFWADKDWALGYIARNQINPMTRVPFWHEVVKLTGIESALEVGCNIGTNLHALRLVDRELTLLGVDVSRDAVTTAVLNDLDVHEVAAIEVGSIWPQCYDLTFTCGVLIHVGDEQLSAVMNSIVAASRRWVLAVEYESADTEMVMYRNHAERLWKRPFGKLYEERGLKLVKYWPDVGDGFDRCAGWLLERQV